MFRFSLRSVYRKSRYCWSQIASFSECIVSEASGVQLATLANGLQIATEETNSPLACISLFVEAGPRFETVCNNGISHFIEHMAYKGFKTISKFDLETKIRSTSSRMTAKTQREMQIFSAQCPSEFAGDFVQLLSMVVTELEFNPNEIEAERHNINMEMIDADNDPKAVVFEYLHATAFQGTPLGQCVIGPWANMCKFDKATAMSFLCDHYQPFKCILATSGNVVHDQIVCASDARFGAMPCDPRCASEDGPCRFTGSEVTYRDDSMPFAHVAVAVEAPGYGGDEYLTMLVMSHMMGSWHKSQGGGMWNAYPIARAAAVDNLCESFQSFYIRYRDVGLWGVYLVAEKGSVEDILSNIQDQWMKLCTMALKNDVLKGINSAKLELAKRYCGAVNSSYDIGSQIMYSGERKPFEYFNDRLCAVKLESVKAAAEKYLYDKCPAVAAVGPTEAKPDYTRIRAGMYWLRT